MLISENVICHHENIQEMPYLEWVAMHMTNNGLASPPPPGPANRLGTVSAVINQGRWVVTCPGLCGGAMVVSNKVRLFLCVDCGSPENQGKWYDVAYPLYKTEIEKELLKRPALQAVRALNRNWTPGESVHDLQRESKEHGVAG